jgi:hypothetical protein
MHAEEGKDSHDHNNQADEIDDSVHGWRSNICLARLQRVLGQLCSIAVASEKVAAP